MRCVGLALALVLCSGGTPVGAAQARITWYDAYEQAIRDIKSCGPRLEPTGCKEWDAAEAALKASRVGGPPQAQRALFPGDVYRPFVPDYFLGLIYLNTGRFTEAAAAFRSVQDKKLVPAAPRQARGGDPLVPTVEQSQLHERAAIFGQAMSNARTRLEAKDIAGARKALKDAAGLGFNQTAVTALENEIDAVASVPVPTPSGLPPSTGGVDLGRGVIPGPDTYANAPLGGRNPDPPTGREAGPARSSTADPVRPTLPGRDTPRGRPDSPGRPAESAAEQARVDQLFADGLRAFLSGDYRVAVRALEEASSSPSAQPRAKIYLACANAGLVLTGQADQSRLALARAQYNSADPQRNLLDEDRRLISPRILERLR